MKYVIVIPDGAADLPLAQLEGRTPFASATMPVTHALARSGFTGTAVTTPQGFEAGSDVCSMSLLGYDPARYHTGRAPLEAAALGLTLANTDWIFRLNLVTTTSDGRMQDHSAGAITDAEARTLLAALHDHWKRAHADLVNDFTLHPGVSYRNILIDRSGRHTYADVVTTPPHAIPGEPWRDRLPAGGAASARLRTLMESSVGVLAEHPVNRARRAVGRREASMAWIWGQGTSPSMPSFLQRYGLRGAMLTSVDLLRGIAACMGWDRVEVPGLTSYHDTDYAAQGRATIAALREYDVVCCHVEAPDEASHQGDWKTKVDSLEAIDSKIMAPLRDALEREHAGNWRMLYLPDHYTLCSTKKHDATPVPLFICGAGVRPATRAMTEAAAAQGPQLRHGHWIMDLFLRGSAEGAAL